MRKFVCLYLNTGGGHRSAALVLKYVLEKAYPDVSVELVNGIDPKNHFARIFFEQGYQASCNYVSGSWHVIYEFGMFRWLQRLITMVISPHTSWYLKRLLKKHNATDVVSLHFGLTPSAVQAIRRLGNKMTLTSIVTDPFSAPNAWFYEKNVDYLVFSEQAKKIGVEKCGVSEHKITVVPFLLNPKFVMPFTRDDIAQLKQKHNIPIDNKVVLLAGGGAGLPQALHIVTNLVRKKPNFTIVVVCGKDHVTKKLLDALAQLNKHVDLRPLGFISYMDEMVKLCDCAVIKAGPATLMEVLVCQKPVIISTYLHGQEFGNVDFAVKNKIGWFIQRPADISERIFTLLEDDTALVRVKKRLKNLPIATDTTILATYLYNKKK